eukprot:4311530-Amphidinium_carterae.1
MFCQWLSHVDRWVGPTDRNLWLLSEQKVVAVACESICSCTLSSRKDRLKTQQHCLTSSCLLLRPLGDLQRPGVASSLQPWSRFA